MKSWNKVAICKLLWCLAQKQDKMWVRWIHGYYIKTRNLKEMAIPGQCSWMVKNILGAREYLGSTPDGQEWLESTCLSIKQIYKALMGNVQRVQWGRMISQNIAPPKCIFICWLLMHGSLPTCTYLQRIGITVDQTCCFCENVVEDLDHLFFGCSFTGKVWQEVTRWCQIQRGQNRWTDEKKYLVQQCTTKSSKQSLYRCAFAVVVYQVWQERNFRRMQGRKVEVEALIRQCKGLIAGRCQGKERLCRFIQH